MFRPCIDLHEGKVKQIVGGTISEPFALRTNFVSDRSAAWFAELYRRDGLAGGHVIMLGPGNDTEARAALAAFPGGLHIGGGINASNASGWLDAGASHVIVTSWVFREGRVDWERLGELVKTAGKNRLVLDLSCRRRDGLAGGHVIQLGPGNESEARAALAAFPGGMHLGGGVSAQNARGWIEAGASHVIVTSWVFREGRVDWERIGELVKTVGKNRLVLDLSCRRRATNYFVVTDRWQKFTELVVNEETLKKFSSFCAEFLIHAVDVEGLCRGIDRELVEKLGRWTPIPTTYAGGANSLADLEEVTRLGGGKIDLTIGSALDIFGGRGVSYADCVKFNRRHGNG